MVSARSGHPVELNGRKFIVDWARSAWGTLSSTREQRDQGGEPGEQSLGNQGVWWRTISDLSAGAGQEHWDRPDSNRRRFNTSHRLDVWDPDCLSALRGVMHVGPHYRAAIGVAPELVPGDNLRVAVVDGFVYLVDGDTVHSAPVSELSKKALVATPHWLSGRIRTNDGHHPPSPTDLDARLRVSANNNWTVADQSVVLEQWQGSTELSWSVAVTRHAGVLKAAISWTSGGTSATNTTVREPLTPRAADEEFWVRVTLDVDNGAGQHVLSFYESTTDTDDPLGVTWSLVNSFTLGGTTALFPVTTVPLRLNLTGPSTATVDGTVRCHSAAVLSGIAGTEVRSVQFSDPDQVWPVNWTGDGAVDRTDNQWRHQTGHILSDASFDAEVFAADIVDLTHDGRQIYVAPSGDGVWSFRHGGAPAQLSTQNVDVVAYGLGRMVGGFENDLFEIHSGGTTTAIFSERLADFRWADIVPSPRGFYAIGAAGDRSEVYFVGITDTSGVTSADFGPPLPALPVPDGEVVRTAAFYGGVMVLATSRGLRLATISSEGYLQAGRVIEIDGGAHALEPQHEFVWFDWVKNPAGVAGLGRLNLDEFTSELVPAYALDLTPSERNPWHEALSADLDASVVGSVATVGDARIFAMNGVGFFLEVDHANLVDTGTLDVGRIAFGISEKKTFNRIELVADPLTDDELTISVKLVAADGQESGVVALSGLGATEAGVNIGLTDTYWASPQITVAPLAGAGCVLRHVQVRGVPLPFRAQELVLGVLLAARVDDGRAPAGMDPYSEWRFLKDLERSRVPVLLRVGRHRLRVYVDQVFANEGSLEFIQQDDRWPEGVWFVRMITLENE